jgi:hypothetical protein
MLQKRPNAVARCTIMLMQMCDLAKKQFVNRCVGNQETKNKKSTKQTMLHCAMRQTRPNECQRQEKILEKQFVKIRRQKPSKPTNMTQ